MMASTSSTSSCTKINYLEDFLVNSGPKRDCLVRICKYIDVFDMINLSESSKHSELFMDFFKERVIELNSFDFTKLASNPESTESFKGVFQQFGPDMQNIKISLSGVTFENFMQNATEYCVPGILTELDIELNLKPSDKSRNIFACGLLIKVRPILNRLERLTLINTGCRFDKIFKLFRENLQNLKSLTLKRFDFSEGWTRVFTNELSNITELRLINVNLNGRPTNFESFLNQLTNLQVFIHLRQRDENSQNEVIADGLYRHFPQLKGFGCYLDGSSLISIGNRFNFLAKFTSLTEIHVRFINFVPDDLHKIIQFVPNMKVFSICDTENIHRPPVAIRLIVQSIKKIIIQRRDSCPRNDRVHIIVNEWQYREFKAIKNISNFIKLSIKPNSFDDVKKFP